MNWTKSAESVLAATPEPDTSGTFYCQAGDHVVDHVVWLESITLGCRPCMEKMGREISTAEWTPRLWSVGPNGARRAQGITPIKPKPAYRGRITPPATVSSQSWRCTICGVTRTEMDGHYNTTAGFVCKACAGTMKMSQNSVTPLQRQRHADEKRRQQIVVRQRDQIEATQREFEEALDPLTQALKAIQAIQLDRDVEQARRELAEDYQLNYEIRDKVVHLWPEHRDFQLSQIPGLKTALSTEARPRKGKVGEFVYVTDTDQLFTWMVDHGWIQVGMDKPPRNVPVRENPQVKKVRYLAPGVWADKA